MESRKRSAETSVEADATDIDSNKKSKTQDQRATVYDNFKQGDLLFGLLDERKKVYRQVTAQGFHHTVANELNSPVVELVVEGNPTEKQMEKLVPEQRQHFSFL